MGVELEMRPIGVDALVFLTSDQNPVDSLTQAQAAGIYAGEITNWKEVGGADAEIIAYQRNETSGSQVMMENVVMDGQPMMDAPKEYRPSEMGRAGGRGGLLPQQRRRHRLFALLLRDGDVRARGRQAASPLDGVRPLERSDASREYPYTQYNYAVIRKDEPENSPARQLFDFLGTAEGKALMAAQGYVPVA